MIKYLSIAALSLALSAPVFAEKEFEDHTSMMNHGDGHLMDMTGGMVMGQNTDTLPGGCDRISATKEITVHAGHKYAKKFPGRMFAFDVQEYQFEPCTKLTVHFVNDDNVRHQWMMHGLPKYLYPKGMFHLEVTGPGKVTGTLIFPPGDKTYLVHCDIAQHMEKGMKGQLKIGKGNGDLPSIPGVTAYVIQDNYADEISEESLSDTVVEEFTEMKDKVVGNDSYFSGLTIIGLAIGLILAPLLVRKFSGMSAGEVFIYLVRLVKQAVDIVVKVISWLVNLVKKR
ncbi:copper oxidase [methanotrophic endosymbiont of Bathymodiolus puteoserpentis (Logatchev)]|jgi:plastocyanin|uniref:copper oxidase n=1 Tax=methanotrophic endosymbiont of Bathymodiolus puteoserpentis (Logatchev) TaxID=343235 RepID=UPI0013C9B6F4|nr:copper oxidase [methanotrophic endosymbiont of Bathymodiolus puteoserpentis (Logatchev)]SHE23011.1 Zinc ABC transporter, periplasmic-binding protein ZnuA [methanotrophic endosymbiont of Bathymodiolus puteoserpentis (Logatchev)]